MKSSNKFASALLLVATAGCLHAQVSMATPSAVKDLRTKVAALAPSGATDLQVQARQAVAVHIGQTSGLLLPVRYSAVFKRDTPVTQDGVQARKMYCAVVQQVAGADPSLLTTIGVDDTSDQECYGLKAIGAAHERDASSLILIYDVGKLPRVSPYALILVWDQAERKYSIDKARTNAIAEHLTTSTTINNIRRFLKY